MQLKSILVFIFCLLITASSFSQKEAYNRTGFYVGPNLGFSSVKLMQGLDQYNVQFNQISGVFVVRRGIVIVPGTTRPAPVGSSSKTSFAGGVQLGYLKQFNKWAAGIEGDVNYLSANVRNDVDSLLPPTALSWQVPWGIHHTAKTTLSESLRAKFGYVMNNSMIYITGGVAFAHLKTTAADYYNTTTYWAVPWIDNDTHPTPASNKFVGTTNNESVSMSATGYTIGIGYEMACSQNCSVGIEYRYSNMHKDYQTSTTSVDTSAITQHPIAYGILEPVSEQVKITSNQVTVRLNVRLGQMMNPSEKKKK